MNHEQQEVFFLQLFISVFGDQLINGNEAQRIGFGLHFRFQTVTEDQLSSAINSILYDPKFVMKAQEQGNAVMDQKEHPLDRAVWWLEHTMRNSKIYQGKNPVHKLNSIQYFQLDVITFLVMIFIFLTIILVSVIYILVVLVKKCCNRGNKAKED